MYLARLKEQNETLFASFALKNIKQVLPIVYTPTVGKACTLYSQIWQGCPRGLYLTVEHIGKVKQILQDIAKEINPEVIVATDGSRILGLGQLGVGGHQITIGKLTLYELGAGFNPQHTLPISFDFGCDKPEILGQSHYLGKQQKYTIDDKYYQLINETIEAVHELFPHCVFQFEDFSNKTAFKLLDMHRASHHQPIFNDDIQGTGVIAASTVYSAIKAASIRLGKKVTARDQRYVLFGAGAGATGVAQFIRELSKAEGATEEETINQFCVVDSKGMITADREDFVNGTIAENKKIYARKDMKYEDNKTLLDVVKHWKPTCLLGLSTVGNTFTEEIIKTCQSQIEQDPIILALSNPTEKCEVTSADAYKFTDEKCFYASGSPFAPLTLKDGTKLETAQCNNFYVFPGIGLGAVTCECFEITDSMLCQVAMAVSSLVSKDELAKGKLLPNIDDIRKISVEVALWFIRQAEKEQKCGKSFKNKSDEEVREILRQKQWQPKY